jgi:hypothetical protein
LLRAGADKDKRDGEGFTPLMLSIRGADVEAARCLLDREADADLVGPGEGATALFLAARAGWHRFPEVFDELVRRSSLETIKRRVADAYYWGRWSDHNGDLVGRSAYDVLLDRWGQGQSTGGDEDEDLVRELLVLGPFFGRGLQFLRRVARSHGLKFAVERLFPGEAAAKAKLAELRAPSNRWRAHDDIVQLVFDFRELREAEAAAAARERRVAELERELREMSEDEGVGEEKEQDEEDVEMGEGEEAPSGGGDGDGETSDSEQ